MAQVAAQALFSYKMSLKGGTETLRIDYQHGRFGSNEPEQIRAFPAASHETVRFAGRCREDDGESFAYERGEFMRVDVQRTDASRQLRLALAPGSKMFASSPREIMGGERGRRRDAWGALLWRCRAIQL